MIYTLTLNPSLDYIMEVPVLQKGTMNRCENTYLLPGGKGINVSMVLHNLGMENTAILTIGGFTGEKLLQMLEDGDIKYDPIRLKNGDTRINVKVLGREETELNAKGITLDNYAIDELSKKITALKEGDVLILSGSLPKGVESDFYARLMSSLKEKKVKVVVDTNGQAFLQTLSCEPFLVKPNQKELEEMFHTQVENKEELVSLASRVQKMGAKNVLVSLGAAGALLVTEDEQVRWQMAPHGKVQNSIGAGDSMVAGFLASYLKNGDYQEALLQGVLSGSASTFSKKLATKEEIDALRKNL